MYYPHIQTLIDLSCMGAILIQKFHFLCQKFGKILRKKKLANLVELALEKQENEKK